MDNGSKDRLASQNLQIPVGSTNRIVSEWLFPCRLSKAKTHYQPSRCYTRN